MVAVSQSQAVTDQFFPLSPCKLPIIINDPHLNTTQIPVINLATADSKRELVKACEEWGFFKVINHEVPAEFIAQLEDQALKFFSLLSIKNTELDLLLPLATVTNELDETATLAGLSIFSSLPPLNSSPISPSPSFHHNPQNFSCALNNYLMSTKKMACRVLEALAEGLHMDQNDAFSRMLMDDKSDSCFRMNHYPPCPSELEALTGGKLVGFGEHTDPQIISVLRSNDACGLEICIGDGNWLPVPPDPNSFFVIVGDSLQVMSNGRFKSVRHRVVAQGKRSRISMIYFGGPPPNEKIAPVRSLMREGEESRYKEFTWREYKMAAYKTRLADYRLGRFEKTSHPPPSD